MAWNDVSTNGTGAFSMYNSSYVSNEASTTEQLSDLGGTVYQDNGLAFVNTNTTNASDAYAAGKIFTSTNGNSSDQTIAAGEKTELEFAIKPNAAGISPSTVYYFRVVGYQSILPNNLYAIGGHLSTLTTAPNGGAANNGTGLNGGTGPTNIKAGNGYPYLTTSAAILPITLTDFNVVVDANGTEQITWVTASERNSANYVVEFGIDGVNFSAIATVMSKNAINGSSYSYTNTKTLPNGINYFRLKAVDKDGTFTYSGIKAINITSSLTKITIVSNPATNTLNIAGVKNGNIVKVFNINAQLMLSKVAAGGGQLETINVSKLAHGSYYVQIVDNDGKAIAGQLIIR